MSGWRNAAACNGEPTEVFFPELTTKAPYRRARELCSGCPVSVECLEDAMSVEQDIPVKLRSGMRGGLTPTGRAALAARMAVVS